MTKLSVNLNKIATIRNARNCGVPSVTRAAVDAQNFGADGITVHPRPDERHIKYSDVYSIKANINIELNIEGYPSPKFLNLVDKVNPSQVTLVPDKPNVITSNCGWQIEDNFEFLQKIIARLKEKNIRVSLFVDTNIKNIHAAKKVNADRVELYTEYYSKHYYTNRVNAIAKYIQAAKCAKKNNLGLNAGHDLNLNNLKFFKINIIDLLEVSIGHALISDSIYFGLENTIQMYKRQLQ